MSVKLVTIKKVTETGFNFLFMSVVLNALM